MLYASFCNIEEIDSGQALKLQDRSMTLHGNNVTRLEWLYETGLKKIPSWLRTLEKVTYVYLGYCDVKEMKGGAFPASLEVLFINNQGSEGLRLHPDSFEGLPNLWWLDASTNKITEDDMRPGLFAGATNLRDIDIFGNMEMRRFNATELFPGGSKTLEYLTLGKCGLTEVDFRGLPNLKTLDLEAFENLPPRIFSGLCALRDVRLEDATVGDETFVGATRASCHDIRDNDAAKVACYAQADGPEACDCQVGACSSCDNEASCGSHSWCVWEADALSCSDPLIANTTKTFEECVNFCGELEGARIPCITTYEDNDELWGRGQGIDGCSWAWTSHFQMDTEGEDLSKEERREEFHPLDATCESGIKNFYYTQPANPHRYVHMGIAW
jgi:hypothetical protein